MPVNHENKVSVADELRRRPFTEFPSSFLNHGAGIDPFPVATAAEEGARGREGEGERGREREM